VLLAPVAATGCGGSDPAKIALFVPGNHPFRNESVIRPNFEAKVEELCEECEVIYNDAGGDPPTQKGQAEAALDEGADILVLDPVYVEFASPIVKAANQDGVPVLDYDQLILKAEPDFFISYDSVRNGELQTETLARKLKKDGHPRGPVVMLNGEPGNQGEHLFQEGARHGLEAAGVKIAERYIIPFWQASQARREMRHAIATLGDNGFAGAYTEIDRIAEGAIAAMKEAGIDPAEKPTTGRWAGLAAVQRILADQQYMTVYEPFEPEVTIAAEIAVAMAEGEEIPERRVTDVVNNGKTKMPAILLEPVAVTKGNVKQTVLQDGFISSAQLCAGSHRSDCRAAGIAG
jgi:D-xylose transport system substrate-binding protein